MIIASPNNDKLLKAVVDGQNTLYFDVCNYLQIVAIKGDVDSARKMVSLLANDGFESWSFEGGISDFEPKNLFKFLAEHGIAVKPKYIDDLAEYLIDQINNLVNAGLVSHVHTKVGWNKAFGPLAFFGKEAYNAYTSNGRTLKSDYEGHQFEEIGEKGDFVTYQNMISKEVMNNSNLKLALALGFTSPVVALLEGDSTVNSIIVNFNGETSKGKSTTLQLMASIWGSGNVGKGNIIKTFNATNGGILKCLEDIYGFPVYFDDTQVKERSEHSGEEWRQLIYSLTTGSSRLTALNSDLPTYKWRTTLAMCSEFSLFDRTPNDGGLKGRLLEFSDVNWTTSAESAENITAVTKNNYGFYGPKFVEGIASKGVDVVKQLYEGYLKELRDSLSAKHNAIVRTTQAGAILLTTANLVKDILGLDLDESFIKEFLVELYTKNEIKEDPTRSAYEELIQWININENHFSVPDFYGRTVTKPSGNVYGKIFIDDKSHVRKIAVITKIADEQVFSHYPDSRRIKARLVEKGLLDCEIEKDGKVIRPNRKVTISNCSSPNPRCYVVNADARYPGDDEVPMEEISEQALLALQLNKRKAKSKSVGSSTPQTVTLKTLNELVSLVISRDGFEKKIQLEYANDRDNYCYSAKDLRLKKDDELEFIECNEKGEIISRRGAVESLGYSKIVVESDGVYDVSYNSNPDVADYYRLNGMTYADENVDDKKAIDEIFAEQESEKIVQMEEKDDED